jgi:nicotinic acid mononucleotide adenylyltransferase
MFATSELKKLQKLIRDIVSGWDDESKFVEFIKWREILSTVSLILKEREYEQDAFELQEYVRRD